jgi:hypothetical protein
MSLRIAWWARCRWGGAPMIGWLGEREWLAAEAGLHMFLVLRHRLWRRCRFQGLGCACAASTPGACSTAHPTSRSLLLALFSVGPGGRTCGEQQPLGGRNSLLMRAWGVVGRGVGDAGL